MIQSMTGYGNSLKQIFGREYSLEIKGVNSRYLDIRIYMPREYFALEAPLKELIGKAVNRGRVDVYINIGLLPDSSREVVLDEQLFSAYNSKIGFLQESLNIAAIPPLEFILSRPDVLRVEQEEIPLEEESRELLAIAEEALNSFLAMRLSEGKVLADSVIKHLRDLENCLKIIEAQAPTVVNDYRERLIKRLEQLLPEGTSIDQERLHNEIVITADRASIDEEIVRLKSHITQFRDFLRAGGVVGRKLDFLLQEANREVNTIASKATDLLIINTAVECKSVLEKIREQIQNIE